MVPSTFTLKTAYFEGAQKKEVTHTFASYSLRKPDDVPALKRFQDADQTIPEYPLLICPPLPFFKKVGATVDEEIVSAAAVAKTKSDAAASVVAKDKKRTRSNPIAAHLYT